MSNLDVLKHVLIEVGFVALAIIAMVSVLLLIEKVISNDEH